MVQPIVPLYGQQHPHQEEQTRLDQLRGGTQSRTQMVNRGRNAAPEDEWMKSNQCMYEPHYKG